MYGTDWRYASTRLNETVVRVGDIPVYVESVGPDGVLIKSLKTGKTAIVPLGKLNLKPVSLGYVNYGKVASYVVRIPKRRDWRQGMRYGNIRSICGLEAQAIPFSKMADTIQGVFPSFKACCEGVNKDHNSLAWDRNWCVDRDMRVAYRGECVGTVVEGNPMLDEKHQYLEECLRSVV